MARFDPYEEADQAGIRVEYQRLRTANGLWVPDERLIIIRAGMRAIHERSTLAHELGHAHYAHRDDRPKHEAQADRYAARKLITEHEAARALTIYGDRYRVALELGVSERLLAVFLDDLRAA